MSGLRRSDRFRREPPSSSPPGEDESGSPSISDERATKRRRFHRAVFVEDRLQDLPDQDDAPSDDRSHGPPLQHQQQQIQQQQPASSTASAPAVEDANVGVDVDVEDCDAPVRRPKDWRKVWAALLHMRRSPEGVATNAPVDTLGCHMLGDSEGAATTFRFTTLVSLMLSSQTKDAVTAAAVRRLQDHFRDQGGLTIANMAAASEDEIRTLIHPVGFYNRKAGYLSQTAKLLLPLGDIPDTIEGLCELPGVGPKMAYLAMMVAWDRVEGIGVDTHVHRITQRLGWAKTQTPEQTRLALQAWLPRENWSTINHLLVGFGQTICTPLRPQCERCEAIQWCPVGRRHPAYRALRKQGRSESGAPPTPEEEPEE